MTRVGGLDNLFRLIARRSRGGSVIANDSGLGADSHARHQKLD